MECFFGVYLHESCISVTRVVSHYNSPLISSGQSLTGINLLAGALTNPESSRHKEVRFMAQQLSAKHNEHDKREKYLYCFISTFLYHLILFSLSSSFSSFIRFAQLFSQDLRKLISLTANEIRMRDVMFQSRSR